MGEKGIIKSNEKDVSKSKWRYFKMSSLTTSGFEIIMILVFVLGILNLPFDSVMSGKNFSLSMGIPFKFFDSLH